MAKFTDREIMERCVALSRNYVNEKAGKSNDIPPHVAAIVVRDGEIIGEGFHPGAGQPHAEVFALKAAGSRATGATIYVNLEPCNHYGRTPPCSEAVVSSKVAKVVVGMVDPDPRVSGGGIARLRSAGIEVVVGVEEADCRLLNEAFIHRIVYHQPFGILKYAMTLDGKIATSNGHSAWITGEAARSEVHKLRGACDAIVIGGNTLRLDNPKLTSRLGEAKNPLRVVMSRTLDLPAEAHLWQEIASAPTLVLTAVGVNRDFQQLLLAKGVMVVELDPLTPLEAMKYLYSLGIMSVLWECGGTLAASAISCGAVQKVLAFIAPKIIGGSQAFSPVGELNLTNMTQALTVERYHWRSIGADCLFEGYFPLKQIT